MLIDERPALRATPAAWEKLWLYISLAEGEVGGLASMEATGSDFLLTETFLLDQSATDVTNELDPAAVSRFLMEYLDSGADPGALKVWWHSHARESVFWSDDDERTISNFGGEMLVSVVGNKAGKFLARLDRFEPRRETIGWLDFYPPGPPPSESGPAADKARAELRQRIHVIRRSTNKPWTDCDLPRRKG